MEATDIIIKDIVGVRHIGDEVTYERVIGVDENSIYFIDRGDHTVQHYSLAVIEPIPLTKDILNANGWKDSGCGWYGNGTPFHIFINSTGFGIISNQIMDIKYVHELQHVMRLCGLNKMANNFKIE